MGQPGDDGVWSVHRLVGKLFDGQQGQGGTLCDGGIRSLYLRPALPDLACHRGFYAGQAEGEAV